MTNLVFNYTFCQKIIKTIDHIYMESGIIISNAKNEKKGRNTI